MNELAKDGLELEPPLLNSLGTGSLNEREH